MPKPTNHLAALDAIPPELIPAAMARLSARLLSHPLDIPDGPLRAHATNGKPVTHRLLTPDEVATRLGVHRNWVYDHPDELGARRLSRRALRIPEVNVERYIRGDPAKTK